VGHSLLKRANATLVRTLWDVSLIDYPVSVVAPASGGEMERINIAEKFARFSEHWQSRIVAELNG